VISSEAVRSLLKQDAYEHPVDDVRLIQTHISWVLLAGDFVYKIKKAVRFGFLDYSTLSRRKEMCEREVRLNRRICPDAYLGVVDVIERDGGTYLYGRGATVEYAVKMRRLSAEGWLSSRVDRGDATAELLRRVAESVHAFHTSAASGPEITRFGAAREVATIWRENLREVAPFVGDTITPDQLHDITLFGQRFLASNRSLIDQRASSGRVRDCHGDLRSDSIHIESDGHICITDCVEFSDRLRCGDVAGDIAFLAMDLDFRGRPDLSDECAGRYVELSPEDETLPHMLPFFRCYRALVRGKVESITTREPEIDRDQALEARERARRYFALARRYATDAVPQALFIVGGFSGTGKSHLAAALAARIGAVLVRSDAVRKEMLGTTDGPAAAANYSPEERARVYEVARERVRTHLEAGRTVVFDATHLERRERDGARALAARCGVPAVLTWVDAPENVIRKRLAARDISPDRISDARWETYLAQREGMDALTELERHDCVEIDGAEQATTNIASMVATLRVGASN
jgi:aminoglycoside phosphotransferase family enzyme/predicted kinase